MKSIFYSFFLLGLMTACQSTTKQLGEPFTVSKPISVDEAILQLNATTSINDIQIEGKIEKSCMTEGCWFTIKDMSGTEIVFDVKDNKFKVPTNSPGKTAVILADLSKDSTTEQKTILSVKGMMFK